MFRTLGIVAALPVLFPGTAQGEDALRPAVEERRAVVEQLAEKVVHDCALELLRERGRLSHSEKSILRWSNPTVGEVYGEVYVWTRLGRPVCIGSIYRWFSPDWGATLELCSLTNETLSAKYPADTFWKPVSAEITTRRLSDSSVPATNPAARFVQLRSLSRRFAARLDDTRRSPTAVPRQLRLMTQPIFRYPPPVVGSAYVDGALFAFVEGTDPELFLAIEAVPNKSTPEWRFWLARMNSNRIDVRVDNEIVWTCDDLDFDDILNGSDQPYALFMIDAMSGEPQSGSRP